MPDVSCSRCGSVAAGLDREPLPGAPGRLVLEQTCSACWAEWYKAQVILMNENRWTPANPEHFKALLGHMSTFLNLHEEGSAPAVGRTAARKSPAPAIEPHTHAGLAGRLREALDDFRSTGVYKKLNYLDSPQGPRVQMEGRGEVIILSSNNYVGLCNVPEVVQAGKRALDRFGAGTGSVRFICGTFSVHRELETTLAAFVGTESALSYVSCWTANEGLMPTLLDESDVVISDALNHASIIDSVRLCKAGRKVYAHSDMKELEAALADSRSARTRFIITDGVFSMEGDIARLPDIVELARKYDAVVAVDDSHGTGALGRTGRGVAEHYGMLGQVDIITSTLGKALGGAAGGFTAASAEVVDYLIQRSRPQLFSNALPPTVAASALAAVNYLDAHPELMQKLQDNARYFRGRLGELGFKPLAGETAIIPVILGETAKAIRMSELLLEEGVFVTGFGFPVVPQGAARVRCQVSAAHTRQDLDQVLAAFQKVGRELKLI